MSTYLSQPNPVTARWEGEDHLRDPNFQLDAFRVSRLFLLVTEGWLVLSCPLSCADQATFLLSTERLGCYTVSLLGYRNTARRLEVSVRGIDV